MLRKKFGQALLSLGLAAVFAATLPLSVFASDNLKDLINNAELNPIEPQSEALEMYLEELMPEIVDDDMEPYDQLIACYDYIMDNTRYGSHTARLGTQVRDGVTCGQIYSSYGEVEGFGAVALTANVGMCNAYASAFILMAREIGLNAYLVEGETRSAGGGYAYHKWAEVNIDGNVYIFDPQLDQDLSAAGLPAYSVFCKTYDEIGGRYVRY